MNKNYQFWHMDTNEFKKLWDKFLTSPVEKVATDIIAKL